VVKSAPTGVIPACSVHSLPGPGCARPPAGVTCPSSTHGAHCPLTAFTGHLSALFPEGHDQPFPPVNVLDESTPTIAIPVSSSYLSVPGPGSARPPAVAPGVVFGTPLLQATYDQPTPTGGNCPASTDDDQPFPPVFVLDESTPTGAIPVPPGHSGLPALLYIRQEWCSAHPRYRPPQINPLPSLVSLLPLMASVQLLHISLITFLPLVSILQILLKAPIAP